MGKAGFTDDALIEISRVEFDNGPVPSTPPSGQTAVYVESGTVKRKNDAGAARTVGPQTAAEVDVDSSVSANALVGESVQAVLNKYYGPTNSEKATYLGNGEVDYIEFFSSPTQTTGNRIAKSTFTYDGNLNPTSEVLVLYDTNGTTVLKTMTFTHTFSGGDYDKTTQVTS